ncbi:MAG TPA: D-alanyl-D-alanine carboxypeptidase/D-alanyl-D-alanine-endopeptidase [Gemmatimonadota bacterium]|nr:D-alanyl-D-alanine carboxypeptidase/D-alanyl-D-alanine-endopeptidase [Gemmatimonadota bacterium]
MTLRALLAASLALAACATPRARDAAPPPASGPAIASAPASGSGSASGPSPAHRDAHPAGAVAYALPAWIAEVATGPLGRAHWGVAIWDLDAGRWVARHAADRYFVPASNLKLVVAATALERLGPAYVWRTSVYGTAPVGPGGVLDGDLVLYGRGDPNLSGRFAPSITAIFEALADSLAARGLSRVTGSLLADESLWDADYVRGDWAAYDLLWWYAAPVGALGFNDNSIDVHIRPGGRVGDAPVVSGEPPSAFYSIENRARTGPAGSRSTFDLTREPGTNRVIAYGSFPIDAEPAIEYFAVVDPAGWAATAFREALARRGIVVNGPVRTVSRSTESPVAAGDTVALAAHVGPPLARVIDAVLGRSQNWHAEQLLKTIGREVEGEGSWRAGLAVERRTLAELGVDTTAFLLKDASGLSSANLVTPEAMVALLAAMRGRPGWSAFRDALPVAAESGSLRRRFAGTPAASRVRAKTGFIENVYSLSGYLTTVSGREYAFSVLVNQTAGESAMAAIDSLVVGIVAESAP